MPGKNRHRKRTSAGAIIGMIDKAGVNLPHLSEVAEHFIDLAGGPRAVAKMLFDEYNRAAPGGVTRQRLLDMISRVWKFGSETIGASNSPEDMSDEELSAELQEIMEVIADGTQEENPPAAGQPEPAAGAGPAPAAGAAATPAPAATTPQPADHDVPAPEAPCPRHRKGPPPPGSFEPV